ncbi:MAG: hypothetical protein ACE37B_10705 [Ilumatobacter sp.]|uniref:hypothetical protein n=1 Tax=Ilumatobacter sp. TaxID=1967498 RepID=UPI00391C45DA
MVVSLGVVTGGRRAQVVELIDATNWADPHQRQWFISNLLQQMHTDPALFDGLDDLTLQSEWGGSLAYLPDTVQVATR